MKFFSLCTFLSLLVATQAQAENFRFNPTPLKDYDVSQQAPGNARLKISVSFENAVETKSISVGGVVACSSSACFRPNLRAPSGSSNSLNGTATLIVDSLIQETTIEKVYFEELKGGNLSGSISLASPLKIENGFYGGEIYITLAPSGNENKNQYKPSYAASNLIRESGHSVYYNPKFAATVDLDLGVTLSLPVGAMQYPTILNAQVNDIGERFALVDIYPYVKLSKPMTVDAKMIENGKSRILNQLRARHPSEDLLRSISLPTISSKNISRLGVLKSSFFESSQTQESWQAAARATTTSSCIDKISTSIPIQQIARNTGGFAYLDWCKDIPPFIHIVALDLVGNKMPFSIPFNLVNVSGSSRNQLRRLIDWSFEINAVAINGFTWTGDEGTGPGQTGLTLGYVMNDGIVTGGNREGGGASGGTGASGGNKLLLAVGSNYTTGPINWVETSQPNYVFPGARNQVSSSTSIVKNGLCSGDFTTNRWSIIGTGPNGAGVLISSTSDGETSAADICSVVNLMLGGNGSAIRLDGGPSAAMVTGGVHHNPLTGLYSFKYGTARYIPYAIKIKQS